MRTFALIGLIAATAALAQQPALPAYTVLVYSQMYLASEALHKELKLDPEQIKLAVAAAPKGLPAATAAARAGKSPADVEKESAKELAFLKPQQLKRLREVTLQGMAGRAAAGRVLAADAEVATRLKLTAEQKQKLTARETLATLLTDEQKKEWKALTGEPFKGELTVAGVAPGGAAGGFFSRLSFPETIQYLRQETVAAELKLTEKQKGGLKPLEDRWTKEVPSARAFNLAGEKLKAAQDLMAEVNQAAEALLDDAQRRRLGQIRRRVSATGLRERDLLIQMTEELKLTAETKKALAAVRDDRQQGLVKLFTPGVKFEDLKSKVDAYNADTLARMEKVLTPEQKARRRDLLGDSFNADRFFVSSPLPTTRFAGPRVGTTQLLSFGTQFVGSPELAKELGLNAEQQEKLAGLNATPFGPGATPSERAGDLEKQLAAFLKPEQMKRLREALLQTFSSRGPGGRGIFASPAIFVEVSEGLKLSDEQKAKLTGTAFLDVLTEAQQAKWKEMLGKPLDGPLTAGFGGRGRPSQQPYTIQMLEAADVAKELALTGDQKAAVAAAAKALEAELPAPGPGAARVTPQQRATALAKAEAAVEKVLDDAQRKRLKEIELQQAMKASVSILLQRVARETLAVTAEQQKALLALSRDSSQSQSLYFQETGGSPFGRRAADADAVLAPITADYDGRMMKLLTPDQAKKLEALLGKPFAGTAPPYSAGGRFAPGGFAPGGGIG
ncbi:MAG: hypothetical protein ACRC33_09370 [Gemmataceae bacterium]